MFLGYKYFDTGTLLVTQAPKYSGDKLGLFKKILTVVVSRKKTFRKEFCDLRDMI